MSRVQPRLPARKVINKVLCNNFLSRKNDDCINRSISGTTVCKRRRLNRWMRLLTFAIFSIACKLHLAVDNVAPSQRCRITFILRSIVAIHYEVALHCWP